MADSVLIRTNDDVVSLPRVSTIRELQIIESDLEDLTALECVTNVERLTIERNEFLRSLSGLEGLIRVGAFDGLAEDMGHDIKYDPGLHLFDNPMLESLDALGSLASVYGHFQVVGNDALRELDGLDALGLVNGKLSVEANAELVAIAPLPEMGRRSEPRGNFSVRGNPRLTTLGAVRLDVSSFHLRENPGLAELEVTFVSLPGTYQVLDCPSLTHLPRAESGAEEATFVDISNNASLESLQGLELYRELRSSLVISANDKLRGLQGIEELTALDQLRISDNLLLESLAAIDPLRDGSLVTLSEFIVTDNPSLPTCDPVDLQMQLAEDNLLFPVDISGNDDEGECPWLQ